MTLAPTKVESAPAAEVKGAPVVVSRQAAARASAKEILDPKQLIPGVLVMVTLLGLWSLVYALGVSRLEEHRVQKQMYTDLRSRFLAQTAPTGGFINPGTPVFVLDAPRADLHRTVVVEGTAAGPMTRGPGHLRSTVLPGQAGVSIVYGRSLTFGAPFGHLGGFLPGDELTATTQQGTFDYVVDAVRRVGQSGLPVPAAGSSHLRLVSTEGKGFTGSFHPSHEVVVDLVLKGAPVNGQAGVPVSSLSSDERAMKGSTSDLPRLVVYLQLLLLCGAGVSWAALRWDRRKAWVLGLPVGVAALTLVSHQAVQLLPNLV